MMRLRVGRMVERLGSFWSLVDINIIDNTLDIPYKFFVSKSDYSDTLNLIVGPL